MAKERETGNAAIAASFSQQHAEDHKSDPQLHKRKSQNISITNSMRGEQT
jgi:hypothetical protein